MSEIRPSLLLVDDTVSNLDILLDALGGDYTIRVATDGASALDLAKETMPELILLDVMMPGMDGFEVCFRLKNNPATRAIPVIFLTAMSEHADETRGLALGAIDYIIKPFSSAIVKIRVRNHIELKKHRDHLAELVAQKTLELTLAYEEVKRIGQLKNDFLRMISHEIRTPANGLLGIGELIIDLCPASEDLARYSDLFHTSSVRLCRLIEDMVMLVESLPAYSGGAVSLPGLLDKVRESLSHIRLSTDMPSAPDPVCIKGNLVLLKNAFETLILLATSFSRDKLSVRVTGIVETDFLCMHFDLDALMIPEDEVAGFFDLGSLARSASFAEPLGLAPVVAHKIIATLGGELRLVKRSQTAGYLEVILPRSKSVPIPGA